MFLISPTFWFGFCTITKYAGIKSYDTKMKHCKNFAWDNIINFNLN